MKNNIKDIVNIGLLYIACSLPAQAVNMHYKGELVAGACDLVVNADVLATVDFHSLNSGSFDANGQSRHVPFTLRLKNCRSALATGVLVTFKGVEDTIFPGLLALEPSSDASGFAVGVETTSQQPLTINATQGTTFVLTEGNTAINLQAWLQKYVGKDITPGNFTASATVSFEYQ